MSARRTLPRTTGVLPADFLRPPLGSASRPVEATDAPEGGAEGDAPGRPSTGRETRLFAVRTASSTPAPRWPAPPRLAPLVSMLAERLLEDAALAERIGAFLAVAPGLPPDVRLFGRQLADSALREPLRRAEPKRGRGRPARWGRAYREAEAARRLDGERLEAVRRWLVSGALDGRAAALFAGMVPAVSAAAERGLRGFRAERTARSECGPSVALHAPRLWAARVLLEATGERVTWSAAERLAKRLTRRSAEA